MIKLHYMKFNTKEKIIEYINKYKNVSPAELINAFGVSKQRIHKILAELIEEKVLEKKGKPPKVFYSFKEFVVINQVDVPVEIKDKIDQEFLMITSDGRKLSGFDAFAYWCTKRNQPLLKTAKEYLNTLSRYNKYKVDGLIDGSEKIKKTFDNVYLDKVFYLDFYSIERFGKTKLGQLLLYAKQSQDKKIIKELINIIKPNIENIIKKYKIDAVAFIPPTVKREVQIMKEFEKHLNFNVPIIKITKIKTDITVPQKTLSKLEDRIDNIKKTIVVEETTVYKNILIIDDAVGSGASLNETANKIKERGICKNLIIGVAITGSFKGFDVISEV